MAKADDKYTMVGWSSCANTPRGVHIDIIDYRKRTAPAFIGSYTRRRRYEDCGLTKHIFDINDDHHHNDNTPDSCLRYAEQRANQYASDFNRSRENDEYTSNRTPDTEIWFDARRRSEMKGEILL